MKIQLLDKKLLEELHRKTEDDGSQRMLNALEVGTKVLIHRHLKSSETVVCLHGRLDVIFYVDMPNMDAGGLGRDFQESYRVEFCPAKGQYGVQIPKNVWHTIEVFEENRIFEAKDGDYRK